MVVNQTNFTIFTTDRFERRVVLYGNQAKENHGCKTLKFEKYVVLYGNQAQNCSEN